MAMVVWVRMSMGVGMPGLAWVELAIEVAALAAVAVPALELECRMANTVVVAQQQIDLLA